MAGRQDLTKLRTKLCEEIVLTRQNIQSADDMKDQKHLRMFQRHLIAFETELTEVDLAIAIVDSKGRASPK